MMFDLQAHRKRWFAALEADKMVTYPCRTYKGDGVVL